MRELFVRLWRIWRQNRGYRALLVRIERLERELFPEWFSEPELFSMAPGAVWVVRNPYDIVLAQHGLTYSARYASLAEVSA